MMSTTVQQPATTPIPVQLSEPEFEAFIFPHLSMPKRGPKMQTGLSPRLQPHPMGALYGDAMEVLAHPARRPGQTGHPLHDYLQSFCQMDR